MILSADQFCGLLATCSDSRKYRGQAQSLLARAACAELDSYSRDHDVTVGGFRVHPAFNDRRAGAASLNGGPTRARWYMHYGRGLPHGYPPGTLPQLSPDLKTLVSESAALPALADALIAEAIDEMTLDLFDESKFPFIKFLDYAEGGPHPSTVDLEARFSLFGTAQPGATWKPRRRVNWLGGFNVLGPLGDAIIATTPTDYVVELAVFARSKSLTNPTTMSVRLTIDDVEVALYSDDRESADPEEPVFFETFDTLTLDGPLRIVNASAMAVELYGLVRVIPAP